MLRLRPYKPCDAQSLVQWLTDEAGFWKWCAGRYDHYPVTADDINNFYDSFRMKDDFWQMTMLDDTKVAGHLLMQFLDTEQRHLKFGCIIVDPLIRGKGYGTQMLTLALTYAFTILKVEQVSLGVFENNITAAHCYERLGFQKTGICTDYHLMGEIWRFHDLTMMKTQWEERQ